MVSIPLNEQLFRQLETLAAARGTSSAALAEEILRRNLPQPLPPGKQRPYLVLPVRKGGLGGPMPGVNLDSTSELMGMLDEEDAARRC